MQLDYSVDEAMNDADDIGDDDLNDFAVIILKIDFDLQAMY